MHKENKKKLSYTKESSGYNCIYYKYDYPEKREVFSICMITSNVNNPRFIFAYDTDNFEKSDIIYLVNCIFTNKYEISL
jgi:hypothetical protein